MYPCGPVVVLLVSPSKMPRNQKIPSQIIRLLKKEKKRKKKKPKVTDLPCGKGIVEKLLTCRVEELWLTVWEIIYIFFRMKNLNLLLC